MYQLYWGDLHSHSSMSYGHGTAEEALGRARQQLDFCSVTRHAFWPGMPGDRRLYARIIDYHRQGFRRLAGNWKRLLELGAAATEPGRFLVFPSYEWHSPEYGDHNVYAPHAELRLQGADAAANQQEYRLRITWGWGRKGEAARWDATLRLSEGQITDVETCFAGPPPPLACRRQSRLLQYPSPTPTRLLPLRIPGYAQLARRGLLF